MRELTVKHRRLDTFNYGGFSDERDAQRTSQIYYDCEQAVEEYLDRGEEPPTLTEWLMGKHQMFKGSCNLSEKAVWNASPYDEKNYYGGQIIDVVDLYANNTKKSLMLWIYMPITLKKNRQIIVTKKRIPIVSTKKTHPFVTGFVYGGTDWQSTIVP